MFQCRRIVFLAVTSALCGAALSLPLSIEQANQRKLALNSSWPAEKQDSVTKFHSTQHPPDLVESFTSIAPTAHLMNAVLERSRQRRIRRALTYAQLNAPMDEDYDMELAEINVFRPLFRYRAAYSKQVSNRQQQFG